MRNKHIFEINFPKRLGFYALCTAFFLTTQLSAQTLLDGYVFEANDGRALQQVKVMVFELPDNIVRGEVETGSDGHFVFNLPPGNYRVLAVKNNFFEKNDTLKLGKEKVFLQIELRRRPGYRFNATLAEVLESPEQVVDVIQGATIEIYNRTTRQPELTILDDPDAFFDFTFERGNHYTMLLRKEGFLTKRIEVYVNVNGCIFCADGVPEDGTDSLEDGNDEATLFAVIELDRARIDQRIQIQDIYYDYDQWDIRADAAEGLNDVVRLMKDNPGISIELGSHTDSRGNEEYNQKLSQRRAAAAMAYIIREGVDSTRITARGYGEEKIANRCRNGVVCSEEDHQQNRRAELRITSISEKTSSKSLQQTMEDETLAHTNKNKTSRPKRLGEANISVPLPTLKPATDDFMERGESKAPTPAPTKFLEPTSARKNQTNGSDPKVRIFQLPPTFKGCAVELARSEKELPANHPAFQGQKGVFRLLENDGKLSYLIANLGPKEAATVFFKNKIKPVNKTAKLVLYTEGGKEYLLD